MIEHTHYVLYEVESEKFIRFGMRLSGDKFASYWLDDISGCTFIEQELKLIVNWDETGKINLGDNCYHITQFIEKTCEVANLVCVPLERLPDFESLNFEYAFPLLEL